MISGKIRNYLGGHIVV